MRRLPTGSYKRKNSIDYNPGLNYKANLSFITSLRGRAIDIRSAWQRFRAGGWKQIPPQLVSRVALITLSALIVGLGFIIGVSAYIKARQMSIRIDDGYASVDTKSTARTVGELMEKSGISVGPFDDVTPPLNSRLTDGMVVTIDRAKVIFINTSGEIHQIYMTSGTVGDALAKLGVEYDSDDEITPPIDEKLKPGMRIKHVAIDSAKITERVRVPFETKTITSGNVQIGDLLLDQKGQDGIRTREIMVQYRDGQEVSREQVSEIVTLQPVDKIVIKGTKPEPTPTPTPTATKKPSSTGKTSNNNNSNNHNNNTNTKTPTPKPSNSSPPVDNGIYSGVTSADLKIPSVPAKFDSMILMEVTAYTHTGRKTAVGTWPQYTRTLAKPGTLAVDPATIPYHTLVYVQGYGYAVTEDTGSFKGDRPMQSDVFMNTESECYAWGRRRNTAVYIIQSNFSR